MLDRHRGIVAPAFREVDVNELPPLDHLKGVAQIAEPLRVVGFAYLIGQRAPEPARQALGDERLLDPGRLAMLVDRDLRKHMAVPAFFARVEPQLYRGTLYKRGERLLRLNRERPGLPPLPAGCQHGFLVPNSRTSRPFRSASVSPSRTEDTTAVSPGRR